MNRQRLPWGPAAGILVAGGVALVARTGRQEVDEYELKSAIVYKLLLYATWPESAFAAKESPFVIGIVGKDPLGKAIDAIAQTKTAQNRRIELRRFEKVSDVGDCHLLFVPATEKAGPAEMAKAVKEKKPLLVGESEGFASKGGAINLSLVEKKIRIEANPDAAKRAGIELSAKFLKVVTPVKDEK